MSTDRDVTRIVRSWLEEGATALPDRVLDAVLDQLPATPQRRAWWPARRFREMNNRRSSRSRPRPSWSSRSSGSTCCPRSGGVGGSGPGPTSAPAQTGGDRRRSRRRRPAARSPDSRRLRSWPARTRSRRSHRPMGKACVTPRPSRDAPNRTWVTRFASRSPSPTDGSEPAIGSGCRTRETAHQTGRACPSSAAPGCSPIHVLNRARIGSRSGRRSPTSSTRSQRIPSSTRRRRSMSRSPGTPGNTSSFRFRRTSPRDAKYNPECPYYRPWEPGIYAQGPNHRWHVWVLDVDGVRVVISSIDYPGTSAPHRAELQAIVDSIKIES